MKALPSPPSYARRPAYGRRNHATLCCLLGLALGGTVRAAPPGAALKKFEEGVRAFTDNNPAEALRLFQASMELEPSPNTRFKIAKCYLALNKTGSAFIAFRRAAREAQDRVGATGEQRFAPTQAAAEAEAAQLERLVPRLSLKLPPELPAALTAEVTMALDDGALPASIWDIAIELDPGPHRLTVTGLRIAPYETTFDLKPSETRHLELPLVRLKTGTLQLSFLKRPAGMAVTIDAKPIAPEAVERPIVLQAGPHKLVASAPGYRDFLATPTLLDQTDLPLAISLKPSRRLPKAVAISTGSVAVVLLGIGIGFGVQAQSTAADQLLLSPLQRDPEVQNGVRTNATLANVFIGLGATFGLATVGMAIATRWRSLPAKEPARVAGGLQPAPVGQTASVWTIP